MHPALQLSGSGVVLESIVRLLLAALLGGIIGLERESKRRAAGLRTNMLICVGSALFTVLSIAIASQFGGDHARIAAQIIPGIGFIGAGTILQARGSIMGLTTASTVFMVASVGMAVGSGLYLVAAFATVLIILCLLLLGIFEKRFNLKPIIMIYNAMGSDSNMLQAEVNRILEDRRVSMQGPQLARSGDHFRLQFDVEAKRRTHTALVQEFHQSAIIQKFFDQGERDPE
jgi:putative Mg2+ transporter-C (MgtC) family protein